MVQIVELCGYFAIVFAVSIGASYFITSLRVKRKNVELLPNTTLQIRSGEGIYRSKFLGDNASGWIISAPLSRDAYVPLRVGEKITVVGPTEHGLKHFQTEVLLRDSDTHELTIKIPDRMSNVERRQSFRVDKFLSPSALVEGQPATLLDLSEGGARVVLHDPLKRGERTAIELLGADKMYAWVVDSSPANPGYVIRLRFEEPLTV
ncbi:MAG TPA: flagellar brake protein [Fimbriimonadaceae bacterium]|jgi:c-di-GMP-binding flagellar brake protein YcgR